MLSAHWQAGEAVGLAFYIPPPSSPPPPPLFVPALYSFSRLATLSSIRTDASCLLIAFFSHSHSSATQTITLPFTVHGVKLERSEKARPYTSRYPLYPYSAQLRLPTDSFIHPPWTRSLARRRRKGLGNPLYPLMLQMNGWVPYHITSWAPLLALRSL